MSLDLKAQLVSFPPSHSWILDPGHCKAGQAGIHARDLNRKAETFSKMVVKPCAILDCIEFTY